jgi:hypothetical protein
VYIAGQRLNSIRKYEIASRNKTGTQRRREEGPLGEMHCLVPLSPLWHSATSIKNQQKDMNMKDRHFRTDESYQFEHQTREMLPDFLSKRGFKNVRSELKNYGMAQSQLIHAISPEGKSLAMQH